MASRGLRVRASVDYRGNGDSTLSDLPAWMRSSLTSAADEQTFDKENAPAPSHPTGASSVKRDAVHGGKQHEKARKSHPAGSKEGKPKHSAPAIQESSDASESRKRKERSAKSLGARGR